MVDLSISLTALEDGFAVRVQGADVGVTQEPLPKASKRKLQAIIRITPSLTSAYSDDAALARLGGDLFRELFSAQNRLLFERARELSIERKAMLRLSFELSPNLDLRKLPFEALHDGARYLASDPRILISRAFAGGLKRQNVRVTDRLRVLMTTASPEGLPPVDVKKAEDILRESYALLGERGSLRCIRNLTRISLEEEFRKVRTGEQPPFDVWHHHGHGGVETSVGTAQFRLLLCGTSGSEAISVSQIGWAVSRHSELQVAVFAVCHSGSLFGLAPELAQLNVPVVMGFPEKIEMRASERFSQVLHRGLAKDSIETAFCEARSALFGHNPQSREWCNAYLFSHCMQEGNLTPGRQLVHSDWRVRQRKRATDAAKEFATVLEEGRKNER